MGGLVVFSRKDPNAWNRLTVGFNFFLPFLHIGYKLKAVLKCFVIFIFNCCVLRLF